MSGKNQVGLLKTMLSKKITPLIKDSYLAVIKNSLGSNIFRNFYIKLNEEKKDALENGKYACAFYVSAVLNMFNLIKNGHCTVTSTLKDMKNSGWYKIKQPKIGCVIHWSLWDRGGGVPHEHLGFYIGHSWAVDTDLRTGQPAQRKFNYRPIESFYWHKKLDKEK